MYKVLANFQLGEKQYFIGQTFSKEEFGNDLILPFYLNNGSVEKLADKAAESKTESKQPKKK